MPREQRGIEPHALGIGFHDIGDGLCRETAGHRAAFLDRTKYRPGGDGGGLEPRLQGDDGAGQAAAHDGDGLPGALLVGLAVPDEAAALLPALGLSVRDSAVLGRRLGAQVAHRRRRADASRGCPHWRRLKAFNGFEGGRYGTNV